MVRIQQEIIKSVKRTTEKKIVKKWRLHAAATIHAGNAVLAIQRAAAPAHADQVAIIAFFGKVFPVADGLREFMAVSYTHLRAHET